MPNTKQDPGSSEQIRDKSIDEPDMENPPKKAGKRSSKDSDASKSKGGTDKQSGSRRGHH